jgi:hypothetical protein
LRCATHLCAKVSGFLMEKARQFAASAHDLIVRTSPMISR